MSWPQAFVTLGILVCFGGVMSLFAWVLLQIFKGVIKQMTEIQQTNSHEKEAFIQELIKREEKLILRAQNCYQDPDDEMGGW